MFSKVKKFISKNYISIIVGIIIIIAAIFRFYRIEDFLTFLGDEGRDVLIVRGILHGNLTFLGPRASAADFFTGPIYYYMMAPFLLASNYNPVGPAIMIALFSVATVYLIYRFGRVWIGESGAIIAAALYAISPLVISYARTSWNPNPMPFFSMVIFYLLFVWIQKPSVKKFIAIGILYGVAFQLHYIEVFVGVIIFTFVLLGNILIHKKKFIINSLKEYASIFVGFLIGISPFLAFEIKHGFPNTKTVASFILNGDPSGKEVVKSTFIQTTSDVYFRLFGRLILNFPDLSHQEILKSTNPQLLQFWTIAVIILAVLSTVGIYFIKNKLAKLLLTLWLVFGVVLFGFYHKAIYDYYFEFMFPLPFLLVGSLFTLGWNQKRILSVFTKIILVALFIGIVALNLTSSPFTMYPNRQYHQVKEISEFVMSKTGGKPYNFALLTLGNSDDAYRYIFETEGHPPTTILNPSIDPDRKSVTDQLLVVCEDMNCQPEGASLWEVAGFGRAKIVGEWPVSVLKVYKLEHYKEDANK